MRRRLMIVLALVLVCAPLGPQTARSSDAFPRPASLETQIAFWRAVFTEHSTHEVLVHDALHLDKIYRVLDQGRYSDSGLSEGEIARRRSIDADVEVERLRRMLLALHARGPDSKGLGSLEQKLVRVVGPGPGNRFLLAADPKRVRGQRGLRDRFVQGLRVSRRYLPEMERIFREAGLPVELTRLPLIESTFNVGAYSKAGAAGIWQFIPSTGRRFMRVDGTVDERRDPIASTRAAARYLHELHDRLGSWPLAITAYNHGPGSIARAIRETGSTDIATIIRDYRGARFGFASRNFYPEFLAALDVDGDPERYFGPLDFAPPLDAVEHRLDRSLGIAHAAGLAGTTREEIVALNPALSSTVVSGRRYIPAGYRLRIPSASGARFAREYAAIGDPIPVKRVAARPASKGGKVVRRTHLTHRIRPGETLSHIAKRHRVSVKRLAQLNGLRRPDRVRAGQVIKIPIPVSTAESAT